MIDVNSLSDDENKILAAARAGELAAFDGDNKPKVRAEFLTALVCGEIENKSIHPKGLQVGGIEIEGEFDLEERENVPSLLFWDCYFPDGLLLRGANLKHLDLAGCRIEKGIFADRLKVAGSVFLRNGFEAKGEVRLPGAEIGGSLDCHGAKFENDKGIALNADGLKVAGGVYLRNEFEAKGEVSLLGAEIGGSLSCVGAKFENDKGIALSADNLKVAGHVFFREGFRAKGEVRLVSADLGNILEILDANFAGALDLRQARTVVLNDDLLSWPAKGKLRLDGFQYERFVTPCSFAERKRWLELQDTEEDTPQPQDTKDYTPQPYEQLAKIFRSMGHNRDARLTLMEKERECRKKTKLSWMRWVWSYVSEYTIGFGYAPWRAAIWLAIFWGVGSAVFWQAQQQGVIVPTKERVYLAVKCSASQAVNCPLPAGDPEGEANTINLSNLREAYPRLNPVMYSLDTLLPFVDLKQEEYWLPSTVGANRTIGMRVRFYLWLHILSGWFLASMGVAGLSGIVKKEN